MKITILGSGTILSGAERKPSAFLLEQSDKLALLDLGPGILNQLKVLCIDLLLPKTIFLTHFHLDHCSDVFPYLMNRYLLESQSNKELKIYGPPGLIVWYETNASLQGNWLSNCQPEIYELEDNNIKWAGYKIFTCPTAHTHESIAYRFADEKQFFFSGDTGYSEKLVEFASDVDLGFLECSHPDEHPVAGHLTPKEAGLFARKANFQHLAINHMYPENDVPDLKQQITREFNGSVTILKDLMVFDKNIRNCNLARD